MNHIYYIGGSPCCGKSTIAEMISKRYGFQYYKADDFLFEFITKGGEDGDIWLKYVSEMSLEQLWLRNPVKLNEEELITYEKLFPYFISALEKLNKDIPIIAEGAAFMPALAEKIGVDKIRYICIVPSREFQIKHFSQRLWVNDYLAPCSDKEKAFDNWIERDILFALSVLEQAKKAGYTRLIVDGSKNVEDNFRCIVEKFELRKFT
jgi:dephospho-CoA kinase